MQKLILFLPFLFLLVLSCGQNKAKQGSTDDISITVSETSSNEDEINNALTFINTYVENCSRGKEALNILDWINSNPLATDRLKTELKKMIDEANEQDPELGLGFDPILDAQDYPDDGFELDSFDKDTGYITVKGIDWVGFKVTMKMIKENDKFMVDGCGRVNISR